MSISITSKKGEIPSKFTPMNVIIWCCVAIFVAMTIAIILSLFPTITSFRIPEQYEGEVGKLVVIEIAAIAIAVFGKSLGVKIDSSKSQA